MDIKDFTVGNSLSIEDFVKPAPDSFPISQKNAAQLAASQSMMGEEIDVDSFRDLRESLYTRVGVDFFVKTERDAAKAVLSDYTKDPETFLDFGLSDEQKRSFVQNSLNGFEDLAPSTTQGILEGSLLAEDLTENDNEAETRFSLLDVIEEVHEDMRTSQQAINSAILSEDQSTVDKVVDFGEFVTPFAEWLAVKRLGREIVGDSFEEGLMGNEKAQIFEAVRSIPYDKRKEYIEFIIDTVKNNDRLVFSDGNDLFAITMLQDMLLNNTYTNVEKFVDNTFSVLDMTGLGGLTLGTARKGVRYTKALEDAKAARAAADVRGTPDPTSPSQILKEGNTEKATAAQRVIEQDETGEAAEALTGTTREDAIVHAELPEPVIKDGPVTAPHKPNLNGDGATAQKVVDETTPSILTEAERVATVRKIEDDIGDVKVLDHQIQNTTVKTLDDGSVNFNVMYRPDNSGWKTVEKAIDDVLFAFRKYPITRNNLKIFRRDGTGNWVETSEKELKAVKAVRDSFVVKKKKIPAQFKDLDYQVALEYNYRWDDGFEFSDEFKITRNQLDALPISQTLAKMGQGSLTQNVFDVGSVLPRFFANSAGAAVDRGVAIRKSLTEMFKGFANDYAKLKGPRRLKLKEYIEDANLKGYKFSVKDLASKGFTQAEIELVRQWRKANDFLWRLTNQNYVRVLKGQGFKMFVDKAGTSLVAKPTLKRVVRKDLKKKRFLDPTTGLPVKLTTKEVDSIYDAGGEIGMFPTPTNVKKKQIVGVISRNDPETGYMREIAHNEAVLSYRDGYYPLMYESNFFIDVVSKNGTKKTVATASTKAEAAKAVEVYKLKDPDTTVSYRLDKRSNLERGGELGERGKSEWSLATSRGMTSQRVRGERLVDADVSYMNAGHTNVVDPLEAVARQINQLSTKISMGDWLNAARKRWVKNYAAHLELPKTSLGADGFPVSGKDVVGKFDADPKVVRDARTMLNYIQSLEDGYINSIDEGFRAMVNIFADTMSGIAGEKFLRNLARTGPSGSAKNAVFKLYLAANPLRQLVIQGHQAVQLAAFNPTYLAKGLTEDLYGLMKSFRGVGSKADDTLLEEITRSGMLDAVDANNLIRQDLLKLAEVTPLEKAGKVLTTPIRISQMLGFDTAERFVLITSWLAHRDKFLKSIPKGHKITRAEYQEIAGAARSFTFAMNRAGDMPYNQNTLAVLFQFFQVPHKAIMQPFVNRNLSPKQRATLMAFNTLMYGVPTGFVANFALNKIEDQTTKDIVVHGLESVMLNGMFTVLSGEEQQISFEDLSPANVHGFVDFLSGLLTTDIGTTLAETPAGSLVFGSNPRMIEAAKTVARWSVPMYDYQEEELQTNYKDVAIAASSLFSGFNNYFKGHYAMEARKKLSSSGNVTDHDVTELEAFFQGAFGFRTETEVATPFVYEEIRGGSKLEIEDAVGDWYKALKKHLARRGLTVQEDQMYLTVLSEANRVFDYEREAANEHIRNLLISDMQKGEWDVFKAIMGRLKIDTPYEVRAMIERLPDGQIRDDLRESLRVFEESFNEGN